MKALPYGIQTDKRILHDATEWCQRQWGERWQAVGNREGTWCVFWGGPRNLSPSMYQWWFETDEQRVLFALRWA